MLFYKQITVCQQASRILNKVGVTAERRLQRAFPDYFSVTGGV